MLWKNSYSGSHVHLICPCVGNILPYFSLHHSIKNIWSRTQIQWYWFGSSLRVIDSSNISASPRGGSVSWGSIAYDNKLISLSQAPCVYLPYKPQFHFKFIRWHQAKNSRTCVLFQANSGARGIRELPQRWQTVWLVFCPYLRGLQKHTQLDDQLPVSASLLRPPLLLADGLRSYLLFRLLWWMAISLSATPGVLWLLSLFLPKLPELQLLPQKTPVICIHLQRGLTDPQYECSM